MLVQATEKGEYPRAAILADVHLERQLQDEKWGEATNRGLPLTVWAVVLGEEVGEVNQAILKHQRHGLRKELTQVAAVAVAMLEALDGWDRSGEAEPRWGVNESDAG